MNFTDYLFEHSQTFTTPFLQEGDQIITHQELYRAVKLLADFIFRRYGAGKEFLLMAENSRFFYHLLPRHHPEWKYRDSSGNPNR